MERRTETRKRPGMETFLPRFLESVEKWPSVAAKEWVEQLIQMACDRADILAIVAFGSIVRNVSHSADVDLLYVYESEKPAFVTPPLDVDIKAYCKADVESLVARGQELLCWSIRFGTVLHQKDRYWSDIQQTWTRHLPLPSAAVAEKRAERARRLLDDLRVIGDDDAVQEQSITMLTHQARACLIRARVFPASRPELPKQLRSIGELEIASRLTDALQKRRDLMETHQSFSPQT
ncbi:MAG: hypothetical protein OXH06_07855 [Gemmatimonadetes bacterium]|nr:hypothetical protein [Gemmatimonadota bacterium]